MTHSPLVSVCIPTYNREKIIVHTLESVIHQIYQNIEIIISDNCSTDNTYKIIQEYARKDNRIKVFQMNENMGPVENWKNCFKHVNGEFVKFLWSDDYMDLDFIQKTMNVFNKNIGFVYAPVRWYDVSTLKINHYNIGYELDESKQYAIDMFIHKLMIEGSAPVSGSCAIFRKSILEDIFSKEPQIQYGLNIKVNGAGFDALMFLYAYKRYKSFYFRKDTFVYFGVDSDGITMSQGEKLFPYYFATFCYFLREFKKKDKIFLSILKTRVLFYNTFIIQSNDIKNIMGAIYDSIEYRISYTYFIKFIFGYYQNIVQKLFRKIFR